MPYIYNMKAMQMIPEVKMNYSVIQLPKGMGKLKKYEFECSKEKTEMIISLAVKSNMPFEITEIGVNVYN